MQFSPLFQTGPRVRPLAAPSPFAALAAALFVSAGASGIAGCASTGKAPSTPVTTSGEASPGGTSCKAVASRLDSVGVHVERASRATYVFDMRITNPASSPRWLVLPELFPREGKEEPAPGRGGIDRMRVDRLPGRGRVVIVHAVGPGGFQALLLPAGGKVTLNELSIGATEWNGARATAKIEVILARDIAIDDLPLASWVQGSLLADPDGDVSLRGDPIGRLELTKPLAPSLTSATFGLQSSCTSDTGCHTVSIEEDCRITAQAVLKHEEP
ncbi:hypothetical protein [Pendulispora albinea]|uniref:Uncharacterized protein n=1 Tax=Pendulispora albinea TaxID=2741071 RepID=A0ABZ2LJ04_9BACT